MIQVENNNIDQYGITYAYDDYGTVVSDDSNQFQVYHGEDRGAKISIKDSKFNHMSFCRGMIWYRRQQEFPYENYPELVNISAQYNNTERVYEPDQYSYIRIKDSEFLNFGFL